MGASVLASVAWGHTGTLPFIGVVRSEWVHTVWNSDCHSLGVSCCDAVSSLGGCKERPRWLPWKNVKIINAAAASIRWGTHSESWLCCSVCAVGWVASLFSMAGSSPVWWGGNNRQEARVLWGSLLTLQSAASILPVTAHLQNVTALVLQNIHFILYHQNN